MNIVRSAIVTDLCQLVFFDDTIKFGKKKEVWQFHWEPKAFDIRRHRSVIKYYKFVYKGSNISGIFLYNRAPSKKFIILLASEGT